MPSPRGDHFPTPSADIGPFVVSHVVAKIEPVLDEKRVDELGPPIVLLPHDDLLLVVELSLVYVYLLEFVKKKRRGGFPRAPL